MFDNEFVNIKLQHEIKYDWDNIVYENIGFVECTDRGLGIYTKQQVINEYGYLYCSKALKKHQQIFGTVESGFPIKRIKYSLEICDQ